MQKSITKKILKKKHGKTVRDNLVKYLSDGPVIAISLEGVDAIKVTRKIEKPIKKDVGLDKRLVTSIKKTIEPNKETIVEVKEEEIKK